MSVRTFLAEEIAVNRATRTKFFREGRGFYCAVVKKMLQKLSFDDKVLNDLVVLDPARRNELTCEPIVRLAVRFTPSFDSEALKNEYGVSSGGR
ncbi:hypothetical protein HHUSO_G15682 [Huso huso]|uniref:Uncharacterized protein n=1 Tax=Huso huso TaxID=61971 RepID=A0ABR0ZCT3_HUSHU